MQPYLGTTAVSTTCIDMSDSCWCWWFGAHDQHINAIRTAWTTKAGLEAHWASSDNIVASQQCYFTTQPLEEGLSAQCRVQPWLSCMPTPTWLEVPQVYDQHHSAISTALGYCTLYFLRAVEPGLGGGGASLCRGASLCSQLACPCQLPSHVSKTAMSVGLAVRHNLS
jgi:hypothetical protein